jgi:hypothetical protein
MQLVVAGALLVLVGVPLAGNVGGLANKAAKLNVRHGFLTVNDDPRSARFTGAMFVVIGLLLAVWGLVHA